MYAGKMLQLKSLLLGLQKEHIKTLLDRMMIEIKK